jgi:hypothetical protein
MNDNTDHHDRADEELLTYEISDQALEAAAETERARAPTFVRNTPGCI